MTDWNDEDHEAEPVTISFESPSTLRNPSPSESLSEGAVENVVREKLSELDLRRIVKTTRDKLTPLIAEATSQHEALDRLGVPRTRKLALHERVALMEEMLADFRGGK